MTDLAQPTLAAFVRHAQLFGAECVEETASLQPSSTRRGVQDGASNTRILTLAQLTAAQTAGDVTGFVDTHIYFNCSAVAGAVYMGGTPLSFPPLVG